MIRQVRRRAHGRYLAAAAAWLLIGVLPVDATAWADGFPGSLAPQPGQPAPLTLDDLPRLAALGEFDVTVDGATLRAQPTGDPCVYFETVYGEKTPGGWIRLVVGGASDEPLRVQTPMGVIVLPTNRLRLHVAPSYAQVFTPSRAHLAPAMVYDDLQTVGRPLTVETYALRADQRYHARVASVRAGRQTAGAPIVLVISDRPFVDGQPTRPPAPRSAGRFPY